MEANIMDGIIQEVFKDWYMKYSSSMTRATHNEILDKIQQELIEKIKQELLNGGDYDEHWTLSGRLIELKLIGDNQE